MRPLKGIQLRQLLPVVIVTLTAGLLCAAGTVQAGNKKVAVLYTSMGKIVFEFYPEDAPKTVENFIKLAQSGFYNGLKFHRVIKGFVIQTGCPRGDGTGGPGYTIKAEFNKRKHLAGTVAMARSSDPDSAGSQFYICLKPQPGLDGKYTVFGQVIEGMDVVEKIGSVPTDSRDRPLKDVILERVRIEEQ